MKIDQNKQKELEEKLRSNPQLLKKYKTTCTIFNAVATIVFMTAFILIILSSIFFKDMPIYIVCIPFFFVSFFLFIFSSTYRNMIKNVDKPTNEGKTKDYTPTSTHIYESESDTHRYKAPDFSSSDRFGKKEYTKNEDKTETLSTKVCPKCGFINKSDAKTCQLCGKEFETK